MGGGGLAGGRPSLGDDPRLPTPLTTTTTPQEDDWEEEEEGERADVGTDDPANEEPRKSGLLVVNQILPDAPAAGLLDVGDILLAVRASPTAAAAAEEGGEFLDCTTFVDLEAMLDDNVGGAVEFMVERGGAEHVFRVAIESLHDLTPRTFLEAGGAVLHPLSFGQARNGHLRMESGVYLSYAGEQQGRPWQGNPAT